MSERHAVVLRQFILYVFGSGAVAGMVVLGTGTVGLAVAAGGGLNGTAPRVAKLVDFEQDLGVA